MNNVIAGTKQFRDTLADLSEIFPQLTPAVMALGTVLQVQEGIVTGLSACKDSFKFR